MKKRHPVYRLYGRVLIAVGILLLLVLVRVLAG